METAAVDHVHLERRPLLDSGECQHVLGDVLSLRESWTQRDKSAPFFTLGTAAYLDARQSQAAYRAQAGATNPVVEEKFGWLLERVKQRVSDEIGLPAEWLPGAARPGFHIFLAFWGFAIAPSAVHFDTQHRLVDWTGIDDPDFSDLLSYTLPIQLPDAGGGLKVWNIDQRDSPDTKSKEFFDAARGLNPTIHHYRAGELVMHSGNLLHQMAGVEMYGDDRRITLQGHGTKANGKIYLYW